MDPQESDSVVQVDWQTTWTDVVFASLRPSDHQVGDDAIFEILNARSDGETLADLCAAKGVTIPMYCVWKAKYRHLSFEELRRVRRRELWRARCVLGVLLATAVLGAGGIVFALGRAAQANITGAAAPMPADWAVDPPADLKVRATDSTNLPPAVPHKVAIDPVAADARDRVSTPSNAKPVEPAARADAPLPITEPGYKIQVAAAPTLQEGRVLVGRLASSGYPAYLSRAIVSDIEVFRVRVGPFDTLPAAEVIASQLQRDGYKGAWIAR